MRQDREKDGGRDKDRRWRDKKPERKTRARERETRETRERAEKSRETSQRPESERPDRVGETSSSADHDNYQ